MKEKPTYLYRHYNEKGELLYVGISLNAIHRLAQHSKGSNWFNEIAGVTIQRFPNRNDAETAELVAINAEKPKHNIKGVGVMQPIECIHNMYGISYSRLQQIDRKSKNKATLRIETEYALKKESQELTEARKQADLKLKLDSIRIKEETKQLSIKVDEAAKRVEIESKDKNRIDSYNKSRSWAAWFMSTVASAMDMWKSKEHFFQSKEPREIGPDFGFVYNYNAKIVPLYQPIPTK